MYYMGFTATNPCITWVSQQQIHVLHGFYNNKSM
jgi:hypothetical protein